MAGTFNCTLHVPQLLPGANIFYLPILDVVSVGISTSAHNRMTSNRTKNHLVATGLLLFILLHVPIPSSSPDHILGYWFTTNLDRWWSSIRCMGCLSPRLLYVACPPSFCTVCILSAQVQYSPDAYHSVGTAGSATTDLLILAVFVWALHHFERMTVSSKTKLCVSINHTHRLSSISLTKQSSRLLRSLIRRALACGIATSTVMILTVAFLSIEDLIGKEISRRSQRSR